AYFINPVKITLLLSALTFIKIFLISFVIRLFSLTLKFRVSYNNVLTITVWGMLPTIFLLISGTFYYRIISENQDFVIIGLAAAGFLFLVSFYRIIKGTYIIFDTPFLKAYAYGIGTAAAVYGALWYYLNSSIYISDYFRLVLGFLKN
ncbi:MAG: hypothetical protein ACRDFC_05670, partial [Ignavibacteria bacterium]